MTQTYQVREDLVIQAQREQIHALTDENLMLKALVTQLQASIEEKETKDGQAQESHQEVRSLGEEG